MVTEYISPPPMPSWADRVARRIINDVYRWYNGRTTVTNGRVVGAEFHYDPLLGLRIRSYYAVNGVVLAGHHTEEMIKQIIEEER